VKGTPVVTEFAVVAPAPAGANPAIGLFLNSAAKARAIGLASTGADTLAMYPAGDNTYPAANVNMKKCAG
jgi:hypothetical protein